MNTKLLEFIKYLLQNYPHKSYLSITKLTHILYLADWKSAIQYSKQLTGMKWSMGHNGLYTNDLSKIIDSDSHIKITNRHTINDRSSMVIELIGFISNFDIHNEEKDILDFVIRSTKDKSPLELMRLVYSTYPLISNSKNTDINLVEMASAYKLIRRNSN